MIPGRNSLKKLMLNLSCGHTVILDKRDVSSAMSKYGGMTGTHFMCHKCPFSAPARRIVERSWIDDRKDGSLAEKPPFTWE